MPAGDFIGEGVKVEQMLRTAEGGDALAGPLHRSPLWESSLLLRLGASSSDFVGDGVQFALMIRINDGVDASADPFEVSRF